METPVKIKDPSGKESHVLGLPFPEDYKDTLGISASELARRWEPRLESVASEQITRDMLQLALTGNLFSIHQWWLDHEEEVKDRWFVAFWPVVLMLATAQGNALLTSFGVSLSLSSIYTERWAHSFLDEMNDFIYDTTSSMLKELIARAEDEQWSPTLLRDRIMMVYDQWLHGNLTPDDFDWLEGYRAPTQRTNLISETESILTVGMAALALYLALGVELIQWWSIEDDRRCPLCGELHGAVIDTGEPFFKPGDIFSTEGFVYEFRRTVMTPPAHVRCRCYTLPYFG